MKPGIARLVLQLTDAGRLIEAGWQVFREECLDGDEPAHKVALARDLYFAGANLATVLLGDPDPGTPDDRAAQAERAELIAREIMRWRADLDRRYRDKPKAKPTS